MMNSPRRLCVALAAVFAALLVVGPAATTHAGDADARKQELAELRKRFKQRYPDLLRLKNQQKVGETWKGMVDPLKADYRDDPVDPKADKDERVTIGELLAVENRDRVRLYKLLAEEMEIDAAVVARRNALRNFQQAQPRHYLKDTDDEWLTKERWVEKHKDER